MVNQSTIDWLVARDMTVGQKRDCAVHLLGMHLPGWPLSSYLPDVQKVREY